jgi:hypothetical protein
MGNQPDLAKDGSSRVYSHTAKPLDKPARAPARVAPRQYMPPMMAGANWATAAKLIRPMLTSAWASPASRKYR